MPDVSRVEQVKRKYWGAMASTYDQRRVGTEKWNGENRVLNSLLNPLPASTSILDIPIGTGRLVSFYKDKGFDVLGMDISEDMIGFAKKKVNGHDNIRLSTGDIFNTGLPDKSFDVTLSIRFMNQVAADDMARALIELQRVTRNQIIFNLRTWHAGTKYRRANPFSAVIGCLQPGWSISQDLRIHQDDFRMLVLSHALD